MPIVVDKLELSDDDFGALKRRVQALIIDYASRNQLTLTVQFSDDDYVNALLMAKDDYNVTAPIQITATNVTDMSPALAIIGAAKWLSFGMAHNRMRNHVQISSDDDEVVDLDGQGPAMASMHSQLAQMWDGSVKKEKIARNLNQCWGSLGSGYAWTDLWRY